MANQVKNANVFAVLLIAIATIIVVFGIAFGPKLNSCLKVQGGLKNGLTECINKEIFNNKIDIKPQEKIPAFKQQELQKITKKVPEPTKVEPVEAEPVETEPVEFISTPTKAFITIENPTVLNVAEVLAIELIKPDEEIEAENTQKITLKNIINQKTAKQSENMQQEKTRFSDVENNNETIKIFPENLSVQKINNFVQKIDIEDRLKNSTSNIANSSSSVIQPISIDEITIDKNNNYISGKGQSGLIAKLFVNDKIVYESDVKNGIWKIYFEKNLLKSPNKQVRIDFSRAETTGVFAGINIDFFDKDNKQKEPYFNYEEDISATNIVVKKGDNLWNLAQKYYGAGYRYYNIYNANSDEINNPHWIYPKQKFNLPY